ncbi:hypothetical protein ACJ72_07832, partial [Emergomyces africanus]
MVPCLISERSTEYGMLSEALGKGAFILHFVAATTLACLWTGWVKYWESFGGMKAFRIEAVCVAGLERPVITKLRFEFCKMMSGDERMDMVAAQLQHYSSKTFWRRHSYAVSFRIHRKSQDLTHTAHGYRQLGPIGDGVEFQCNYNTCHDPS